MHSGDRENKKIKLIASVIGLVALFAALIVGAQLIDKKTQKPTDSASTESFIGMAEGNTGDEEEEDDYLDTNYLELFEKDYSYTDDIQTYLFMGTDGRGNENGKGKEYCGDMADVVDLVVLNKTKQTYAVLQFDRDLMINVPMTDDTGKVVEHRMLQLCIAHAYGLTKEQSSENVVDTISDWLGVDIDGYYTMPVSYIQQLNHAVGGVTVKVLDDFSKKSPNMKKGAEVKLTDEQAQMYVQGRMDVADGTNISRMARQQQYMNAFSAQAKKKMKEDPKFVNSLYESLNKSATTDISGKEFSKIVNRVSKYKSEGILTFKGEHKDVYTDYDQLYHTQFTPDKQSVIDTMTKLYGLTLSMD